MNSLFLFSRWLCMSRKAVMEMMIWCLILLCLLKNYVYIGFLFLFILSVIKVIPIFPAIFKIAKKHLCYKILQYDCMVFIIHGFIEND